MGRHEDYNYKVIILGEAGVGKTSLIRRYTQGTFSSQTTTTVGVDRIPLQIQVDDETLDFQALDTAGCFAFHTLIKSYINTIDAVIFVYDLTDKESFACLPWNSIINRSRGRELVKILVGNKNDLVLHREVQFKNAKNYAEFEGMVAMEVSAKEDASRNVFESVARELRMKNEITDMANNELRENNTFTTLPRRPKSEEPPIDDNETSTNDLSRKFRLLFKGRKSVVPYTPKCENTRAATDDTYALNSFITSRFHLL